MTRAQETAQIIQACLPNVPVESCSLIEEGAPVPPEPAVGHWKPELYVILCFNSYKLQIILASFCSNNLYL